jgi:hypothetical protein
LSFQIFGFVVVYSICIFAFYSLMKDLMMPVPLDISMNKVENSEGKMAEGTGAPESTVEDYSGCNPQPVILDPKIPSHALQPIRPAGLYETWHMEETLAGVYLLYGHPQVLTLAQKLACRCLLQAEHLIVLDGANVFDPYLVSRLAAKMGRVPTDFLRSIRVSRSFTCHQMLSLVRQIESADKLWKSPFILLLGPLTTFYDESVPHYEAWKLFRAFQRELNRLSAAGFRLLLSCQQPSAATKRDFVQQLKASAQGIASCWEMRLAEVAAPLDQEGAGGRPIPPPRITPFHPDLKREGNFGLSLGRADVSRRTSLVLKVEKPAEPPRQWVLRRGEKVNSRYLSL